jgi:arylsulfatase A-like enzyme
MRRVIIVLTDGLRPDAVDRRRMPTLARLAAQYTSARAATTVRPSTTVSALSTLATGLTPQTHGLLAPGPDFLKRLRQLRPLPRELSRAGLRTRIVASDLPLGERSIVGMLSATAGVGSFACVARRARDVARSALKHAMRRPEGVLLVYLNDCDRAGHTRGWMSAPYLEAAAEIDSGIAQLAPLAADSLLIVLADHGGGGVSATNHAEPHPDNDRIPLILAGPGVALAHHITRPVSIVDVPPTICHWLGLPVPDVFEGRALSDVVTPLGDLLEVTA